MCEVGAGTGGLTRDAFPILDVDNNCELLQYTATDISNVWAPKLLESIGSSKMQFKVRIPALHQISHQEAPWHPCRWERQMTWHSYMLTNCWNSMLSG